MACDNNPKASAATSSRCRSSSVLKSGS